MAEELEVIIGANTKDLEQGANRAERALDNIQKSISRLQKEIAENITISRGYKSAIDDLTQAYKRGDISQKEYSRGIQRLQRDEKETNIETKRLTRELSNLNREQKQLQSGVRNSAGAMNTFGKATSANAVPAMTSFSQVMQDAPYGIQGVANNIQQLTMQFGYLQKSAGGTKAALKSMLASLAGPAGILLAVSLVTTLLITFGDKLFDSGEEAKSASDKMDDYAESLKGVNRAALDAGVSAAKELVNLRLLSQQSTNAALSTEERTAAVNKLRELYPSYLKSMTDEQILANGLTTAYNDVTNSIMRKARAEAASNVMVKNEEERLNLADQLAVKMQELEKAQSKLPMSLEEYDKATKNSNARHNEAISTYGEEAEAIRKLGKEINNLQGEIQTRDLENISLAQSIKATGDLIITPENVTVAGQSKDGVRIPVTPVMGDLNMSGSTNGMIQWKLELESQLAALKEVQEQLPVTSKEYRKIGEEIAFTESRLNGFVDQLAASGMAGAEHFAEFAERIKASNASLTENLSQTNEFANMFASSVGGAISEMGNNISQNLSKSSNIVEKFAGMIINTGIQMISQLAQQALKELAISQAVSSGKAIEAGTKTAAASGPAAAFVLPGLVAATLAVVGGAFSGLKGFNFGGFVGDRNLVRMNGDERVLTATQANRIDRIAMGQNVGMSGQRVHVDISGMFVQRGSDLVATVNQTQQVQSRRG